MYSGIMRLQPDRILLQLVPILLLINIICFYIAIIFYYTYFVLEVA